MKEKIQHGSQSGVNDVRCNLCNCIMSSIKKDIQNGGITESWKWVSRCLEKMGTWLEWRCLCPSLPPQHGSLGSFICRAGAFSPRRTRILVCLLRHQSPQNSSFIQNSTSATAARFLRVASGLPRGPPHGLVPITASEGGSPSSCAAHRPVRIVSPQSLQLEVSPKQFLCDPMQSAFPGKCP